MEYFSRLFACSRPFKFLVTPLNVVDLLAILPFYIELISGSDGTDEETEYFRVLRVIRLARIFRLFKAGRYSSYLRILGTALQRSMDAFGLLCFLLSIAIVIFSSLMYYAERGTLDEDDVWYRDDGKVSPFSSIPATFYWCVVTMTTVGYGDMVPLTSAGMVVAAITMLCGIMVLALPISVLGQNFSDAYAEAAIKKAHDLSKVQPDMQTALGRHAAALKQHRLDLDKTLLQLRFLLEQRPGAQGEQFRELWNTMDLILLTGLYRIENYLLFLEKQGNLSKSLAMDSITNRRNSNSTNRRNSNSTNRRNSNSTSIRSKKIPVIHFEGDTMPSSEMKGNDPQNDNSIKSKSANRATHYNKLLTPSDKSANPPSEEGVEWTQLSSKKNQAVTESDEAVKKVIAEKLKQKQQNNPNTSPVSGSVVSPEKPGNLSLNVPASGIESSQLSEKENT